MKNNLVKKSKELRKDVEEKIPINSNKKEIEKQIAELKVQILQHKTENISLKVALNKIHSKCVQKITPYIKFFYPMS